MGIFKLIKNVITTPIDVVKDVATMGGAITDQPEPYTVKKLKKIGKNLKKTLE